MGHGMLHQSLLARVGRRSICALSRSEARRLASERSEASSLPMTLRNAAARADNSDSAPPTATLRSATRPMNSIRLCLVLHNHQPVGNFDGVFEQAYQDSYLPFLDVFEQYDLPIALHTSGPLMEWLDERHPEYVDRLARLVAAGRIEIIGGPFYEPILTMIPPRDRVGQITALHRVAASRGWRRRCRACGCRSGSGSSR